MRLWNDALKQELPDYPSMRVYNWPAVAQKSWFINDGIHYTSAGYEKRALFIADGLAEAFPLTGTGQSCLVNLPTSVTPPPPSPSPTTSSPGGSSSGTPSSAAPATTRLRHHRPG
jgi:hypothetical protein